MLTLPDGRNEDRVREVLAGCSTFEEVQSRGVLFHGSCEQIKGPLHGGGYDGIFWTAPTPAVAQAYIPRSGCRTWISAPQPYEREDHLQPCRWPSHAMEWALQRAGVTIEDLDVTWDGQRAWSWTIPKGWPTLGDYEDLIVSLGYSPNDSGLYEVSQNTAEDGTTQIMPENWKKPGQLIIILGENVRIDDPDWSDEAYGYRPHNRLADFDRFEQNGQEAFRMYDQLQSDYLGNVDHPAVGIFPEGLKKLSWLAIPAVRHDGSDPMFFTRPETAEFCAFMRELNPDYSIEGECEEADTVPEFG